MTYWESMAVRRAKRKLSQFKQDMNEVKHVGLLTMDKEGLRCFEGDVVFAASTKMLERVLAKVQYNCKKRLVDMYDVMNAVDTAERKLASYRIPADACNTAVIKFGYIDHEKEWYMYPVYGTVVTTKRTDGAWHVVKVSRQVCDLGEKKNAVTVTIKGREKAIRL